jgi:hypothetical protein
MMDWEKARQWDLFIQKVEALQNKKGTVKKTLTIPRWLDEIATEYDINFSQVLTEALREKLGV